MQTSPTSIGKSASDWKTGTTLTSSLSMYNTATPIWISVTTQVSMGVRGAWTLATSQVSTNIALKVTLRVPDRIKLSYNGNSKLEQSLEEEVLKLLLCDKYGHQKSTAKLKHGPAPSSDACAAHWPRDSKRAVCNTPELQRCNKRLTEPLCA